MSKSTGSRGDKCDKKPPLPFSVALSNLTEEDMGVEQQGNYELFKGSVQGDHAGLGHGLG